MFYLRQLQPEELREKFINVNEDFLMLKKFTRKQEDKITRLQTKLRKLISDQKRNKSKNESESFRLWNIEHEEEIETLKQTICHLKNKNKSLEIKLKVANVQLSSSRQYKVPLSYRHVTPRVDSGLKQGRKVKSLTNIPRSIEGSNRTRVITKLQIGKDENPLDDKEDSLLSSPCYEESVEMSNQVRFILEEARKRIIELEDDQEHLLQQLSDTQQNAEDQEREFREKNSSLERELERRREESRERQLREQRERTAFIRNERQSRAVSARASALSEHLMEVEGKLCRERKLEEEALEALEMLKIEVSEKEARLKDVEFGREKLEDEIRVMKDGNLYLKKQVKQLQAENDRLTDICLHESKYDKKRDEMRYSLQNEMKLIQSKLQMIKMWFKTCLLLAFMATELEARACQTAVDETAVDETAVDETAVDETAVDERQGCINENGIMVPDGSEWEVFCNISLRCNDGSLETIPKEYTYVSFCNYPFENFNQIGCIAHVDIPMTWCEARKHCLNLGSDLLAIENFTSFDPLVAYMYSMDYFNDHYFYGNYETMWVGLWNKNQAPFSSTSGGILYQNSSLWYNGFPYMNNTFNCGFYELIDETMKDAPCTSEAAFMCEIPNF